MNPDHASSAIHKMVKIMLCKGDTIANLAEGAQILVQGHGNWIKLAGLIKRLTTLADAPELIVLPSANQWGIWVPGLNAMCQFASVVLLGMSVEAPRKKLLLPFVKLYPVMVLRAKLFWLFALPAHSMQQLPVTLSMCSLWYS